MNDKAVYRTDPATLGLSNMRSRESLIIWLQEILKYTCVMQVFFFSVLYLIKHVIMLVFLLQCCSTKTIDILSSNNENHKFRTILQRLCLHWNYSEGHCSGSYIGDSIVVSFHSWSLSINWIYLVCRNLLKSVFNSSKFLILERRVAYKTWEHVILDKKTSTVWRKYAIYITHFL